MPYKILFDLHVTNFWLCVYTLMSIRSTKQTVPAKWDLTWSDMDSTSALTLCWFGKDGYQCNNCCEAGQIVQLKDVITFRLLWRSAPISIILRNAGSYESAFQGFLNKTLSTTSTKLFSDCGFCCNNFLMKTKLVGFLPLIQYPDGHLLKLVIWLAFAYASPYWRRADFLCCIPFLNLMKGICNSRLFGGGCLFTSRIDNSLLPNTLSAVVDVAFLELQLLFRKCSGPAF